MRIIDLFSPLDDQIEQLTLAAQQPSLYIDSCDDLAPEEVAAVASKLAQLSRLASTLAELALDTIAKDPQE